MTVPFSPLADIVGRWPVSYLDAIHSYLESLALAGPLASVIVNGGFDVWQEGPGPFTVSGYTADQWRLDEGAGNTCALSRVAFALGQSDVPGEPSYYASLARTVTAAAVSGFQQRVESVRTFAGQSFSVSLWMRASVAQTVDLIASQVFGTGGAPSPTVATTLASFALTTSWALYTFTGTLPSIAGKTLGTANNDYLQLEIQLPVAAGNFTLDFSSVDARGSASPGTFAKQPLPFILDQCERFFRKSYNLETLAGAVTQVGMMGTTISSASNAACPIPFSNRMRATPTITVYNSATGAAGTWRDSGAANRAPSSIDAGEGGIVVFFTTGGADGVIFGHYTASARL